MTVENITKFGFLSRSSIIFCRGIISPLLHLVLMYYTIRHVRGIPFLKPGRINYHVKFKRHGRKITKIDNYILLYRTGQLKCKPNSKTE